MSKDDPQDIRASSPKGRGKRGIRNPNVNKGITPIKQSSPTVSPTVGAVNPTKPKHTAGYFPYIQKRSRSKSDQGEW